MRNRTKFVIATCLFIVAYTIAVLILSAHDHSVPDSLTMTVIPACTAELGLLFGIKIKDRGDSND